MHMSIKICLFVFMYKLMYSIAFSAPGKPSQSCAPLPATKGVSAADKARLHVTS